MRKIPFSWFLSEKGKFVAAMGTAATVTVGVSVHMLSQSVFIGKYVEFVQMYRAAQAVAVPDNLKELSSQVIKDCKMPPREQKLFTFFTPIGFDIFHVGATMLSNGSYVGIPYSYRYKNTSEIDKSSILIKGGSYNFNSEAGKVLLTSMVMSENAIKFAIAREVYSSYTYQPFFNYGIIMVSYLLAFAVARSINIKMNLYAGRRGKRLALYLLSTMLGIGTCMTLKDTLAIYYDKKADRKACEIDVNYCKGGVEFYEKLLERNKGLREALGSYGNTKYTAYGNETVLFRTKTMPLLDRLKLVKAQLESYEPPAPTP